MTEPGTLEELAEFVLDVLHHDAAEQVVNIKDMLNDTDVPASFIDRVSGRP